MSGATILLVTLVALGATHRTPAMSGAAIEHVSIDEKIAKEAPENDLTEQKRREREAEAARQKTIKLTTESYTKASSVQREGAVRSCMSQKDCDKDTVGAIIASAGSDKERHHLQAVSLGEGCRKLAQAATDGADVNSELVGAIASAVRQQGVAILDTMPKAKVSEASKDPEGARGSVIRFSGTIVEIRKASSAELFEGAIVDSGRVVRFVTPLSTDGIVDGSWVTFRGIFIQEYAYPNVSGGQTRSLLAVGAFQRE